MAKIEAWLSCDLKKPVQVQGLSGNVFSMDNNGSRINVRIYDNGEKTTVSGSVTANCILADGSTINVNGSLTTDNGQSVAYVDIPQSCLLVPGPIRIAIKLTASGVITTLAAVVTTVYRTQTDIVITPSAQIITDWNAEISAAIATQNATIANQDTKINDLKSAINGRVDRINNGTIIKNNLIDFKNIIYNSILSDTTGNISGTSAPGFFTTDFMPVTAGALYYVAKASRICFYNSSKVFTEKGTRDSTSFTVPSGSSYLRISWYGVDVPLVNQYVINSTDSGIVDIYEMLGLTEELYKYRNLFDAFELISGNNYINSTTGAIASTSSKGYFVSKPIPIMASHDMPIVLSTSRMFDASIPVGGRYLDSNLAALESASLTYKDVNSNYIISYPPIGAKYIQVTYINEPSTESTPDLFVSYGTERVDYQIVKGERYRVDIYHTNDIADFYETMQGAFFKGNCDVYIHAGEYTYTNAFMESLKRTGVNVGVPIGNNCRYYFDTDATIYCEYTGSYTSYMAGYFSALESKRVAGSYELHNATIIAKNILYGIHDEAQGKTDPYLHLYENCRIVLDNTNAVTKQFDHAIGGGLGANAEIILRDCYFEATSNDTRDISYHGNPNGDNCNMVITGCYFKHTLALDNPNGTDTKNLLFSNNCMNAPINYRNDFDDHGSWKVKEWNNYIRNE